MLRWPKACTNGIYVSSMAAAGTATKRVGCGPSGTRVVRAAGLALTVLATAMPALPAFAGGGNGGTGGILGGGEGMVEVGPVALPGKIGRAHV